MRLGIVAMVLVLGCGPSMEQVRTARAQEYALPVDVASRIVRNVLDEEFEIEVSGRGYVRTKPRLYRYGDPWVRMTETDRRGGDTTREANQSLRVEARFELLDERDQDRFRVIVSAYATGVDAHRGRADWADEVIGELQIEVRDRLVDEMLRRHRR